MTYLATYQCTVCGTRCDDYQDHDEIIVHRIHSMLGGNEEWERIRRLKRMKDPEYWKTPLGRCNGKRVLIDIRSVENDKQS
jgi:5-methylcytosine-specific restriction endonuclease McrA